MLQNIQVYLFVPDTNGTFLSNIKAKLCTCRVVQTVTKSNYLIVSQKDKRGGCLLS